MSARDSSGHPKCAACKRRLKHPSPSGLGPVCERRLHGPATPQPRIPRPAAQPGTEQPELPYTDQLAIWSP